ncbi:hypothetical protein DENIS_2293 [Desulfonema ishimotonii]|uniref:Uncharacterized protein n=1 Tax=Desulfonema ishimotonii TaxID=45657 RepID=A0A401FWL3_9BACT|nr:hypothetical protein [Desulfonema ishimotonii]GBC61333.1 hypothetical protein DENIS_2293 [Desulfonema ishimotonii]
MQLVEIITIRSPGDEDRAKMFELFAQIKRADIAVGLGNAAIKVYSSPFIENDFSIHIHRIVSEPDAGKSHVGLQLARLMKPFGLIHHSVWLENGQSAIRPRHKRGANFRNPC